MTESWLGLGGDAPTGLELAQAQMARDEAREAAQERREQADREAERERRLESLTFAERQFGSPLAGMSAARSAFAEADDEVRDLRGKLEKAEARRSRAEDNLRFFAERAELAAGLASRSAPTVTGGADLLAPARRAMAEAAREDDILRRARRMQEQQRPRLSVRSASPPKAPDGQCSCGVPGCTAYTDFPDQGERASRVDDLIAKGYSPRTAQLAQEIVRARGGGYVMSVR